MRIALGSDEEAPILAAIEALCARRGDVVERVQIGAPWPRVGSSVASRVAAGGVDYGIVCCWTGTGVSIAANKVPGVRAALCVDAETAAGARRYNDANVLALSLRLTDESDATDIVDAFLTTAADESEAANVAALEAK